MLHRTTRFTKHANLPDPPLTDEVEKHVKHELPGPTQQSFRIDYNGHPQGPWNSAAALVFCESFLDNDIFADTPFDKVEHAFTTYLKRLREVYRVQEGHYTEEERKARQKRDALRTRKLNMYDRRLHAASVWKHHLKRHFEALVKLGVDGMSSDETDHEAGIGSYRVINKAWRHPSVRLWLRALDWLHLISRLGNRQQFTPGNLPRERVPSDRFSKRSHVPNLPRNFYEEAYINGLSEHALKVLNPAKEYELVFDEEISR
ncbi:hypothetical protein BOTBODRAFT_121840 [Botryobasidium botryosum FD-172 SS1]|uniref:Uncharacterized protein n=1 Tax=Botryobasidium botryosum (strain FD-172 SS1) TaxID=930990 RepID=A0A067LV66_BOTB1|nr:hypothetical protein BOTBODRAFT_121840 [Botryobasidium botryosum FD-172 SS1]